MMINPKFFNLLESITKQGKRVRERLLENLDLFSALSFDTLVVDDVDRPGEKKLVTAMVNHLYKQYKDQIDLVVIHSDSIGANLLNPFIAVRTRPKNKKK